MGATSDNYQIVTSGVTYTIASDYVKPTGGETAHFQLVKVAYGADNTANYVSNSNPLPVGLCGAWTRYEYLATSGFYGLATTIVGITGTSLTVVGVSGGQAVGITVGTLSVSGSDFDIRNLYGGAIGSTLGITATIDYVAVQGLSGGFPVGITTSSAIPVTVASLSDLGVFGVSGATAIGVTFGTVNIRGLTAQSDSIVVFGGGTASTVSAGLFGFESAGANAVPIHTTGNALNVNISTTTSGVTVSATDLDIRDLSSSTDSVTVVGQGALDNAASPLKTVPTYVTGLLNDGTLAQIGATTGSGWCGGALNVSLVNSGITFAVNATATFSAEVGVTATYASALPVQGSTYAAYGVWVTGSTGGDPVSVRGASGGYLPVEVKNFDSNISSISGTVSSVKTNTDFMAAVKKALYDESVSVGAFDFSDNFSIYTLIRDQVAAALSSMNGTVLTSGVGGVCAGTQDTLAVSVIHNKMQPTFMSRTGYVGNAAKSLTEYNSLAGFTCNTGIRIKASRVATGASASSNEFMCIISEADVTAYGATAGTASYTLYHGEELFVEADNINRLRVFYPPYSASFAPHNTGPGMTFSFYAS